MEQYRDRIKYIAVGAFAFLSFLIAYSSFQNSYYPVVNQAGKDKLSGEEYAPVESERNPYAPYFVGFDELISRGVSRDETRYINDVITNFVLYNEHTYKSKVSYVGDSFERDFTKSLSTTYRFKFGINNSNIHTVIIKSNTSDKKISVEIRSTNDKVLFNKDFYIYAN